MLFDFETFSRLAKRVYTDGAYTLDEVLSVFYDYFAVYERYMRRPHPNIRLDQIKRIIRVMPYLDEYDYGASTIEPEDYKALILKHFNTVYRRCDYNINHFFSGRIRELRFYEELY